MSKDSVAVRLDLADHGQDFLWFIVQGGQIVKAGPFQNWIWRGKPVSNGQFSVGDRVEIVLEGKRRFINYPIERVTLLDGKHPVLSAEALS